MRFKNYLTEMAYPTTFNSDHFKALRTPTARKKYANEKLLGKLGQGSSRAVFKIDDDKALKVAINVKGYGQNEAEYNIFDHYSKRIVAEIFDGDFESFTWIESEIAPKPTIKEFRDITGLASPELVWKYAFNVHESGNYDIPDEVKENEFANDIVELIGNYGLPIGDFGRLSSYGKAMRDGKPTIIVTDYGLTKDVLDTYYRPKRRF